MAENEGGYGGALMIPAYVFAVGHHKNFIIAKQHPLTNNVKSPVDVKRTNYYIIDVSKDNYYKQEGVYGPFAQDEFNSECKILQTGSIEFDMDYPDNP